jgi:hypothetical protein
MGCCRNIFRKTDTSSVLCLSWLKPIRVFILVDIAINSGYVLMHQGKISLVAIMITIINLLLCWTLLTECRRSEIYHRQFTKQGK